MTLKVSDLIDKGKSIPPWVKWFDDRIGWTEFDHDKELSEGWKYTGLKYTSVIGKSRAWCAMSGCTALETNGYLSVRSAAAKAFSRLGTKCDYVLGAFLPIRHANGHYHVTVFIAWKDFDKELAYCLGGNQSNKVCISVYNLSGNKHGHDEVLECGPRWPIKNDSYIEEDNIKSEIESITTGHDNDEATLPWYKRMYSQCKIDSGYNDAVQSDVDLITKGKNRYSLVSEKVGLPWYVIGAIHFKEGSCNFEKCLANGERIIGTGKKTTIVPKDLGPWNTWEESAIDILTRKKFHLVREWNIETILYYCERYNGLGYVKGAGILENSPYLWARTNINDDSGKYVSDGKFNPSQSTNRTSGIAAILKIIKV